MASKKVALFLIFSIFITQTYGGPATAVASYGACQTACNAAYVLCCSIAGTTAGTFTLGLGIPAALGACSATQAACMVACAAAFLAAPTP